MSEPDHTNDGLETLEFGENYCVYIETVDAGCGNVLEFPCKRVATYGLFCEDHAHCDTAHIED